MKGNLQNNEMEDYKYLKPKQIQHLIDEDIKIQSIYCGGYHSLAISTQIDEDHP